LTGWLYALEIIQSRSDLPVRNRGSVGILATVAERIINNQRQ
jgi:hypothetical protein